MPDRRPRSFRSLLSAALVATASAAVMVGPGVAAAQPRAPTPAPPSPSPSAAPATSPSIAPSGNAPASPPAGAAPSPSAAPATLSDASSALAAPPAVDDPLLTPPPAAPRTLTSWQEALALVRSQSPDYLSTYDNVLRAEAQSRIALAAILPGAVGQGVFTHQFLLANIDIGGTPITLPLQDTLGASVTATWNIGDPRGWYGIGTARQAERIARMDLAEKRRVLVQSITAAMLATLAAERVAELNRVGLQAALARLTLAQAKARLGSGTALDIDRAEQDAAAARTLVVTGDESLRQSREALGLALGSPTPIAAPGDLDMAQFEEAIAGTCRMNAELEARADIAAARERVHLAERTVDDVWLQFVPSVSVVSQLAWGSQALFGPQTTWNVEGVLNVPIWDGGARYGRLRDARAAVDQARQALAQARLAALVNVTQSQRAIEVARASRDLAQRQRDLAQRIDQRTREGYLHGLGTSLDLVTSAQALRQAEINLVLLQFQAAEARVGAVLANADCAY